MAVCEANHKKNQALKPISPRSPLVDSAIGPTYLHAVVVLPTYNEVDNISNIIQAILAQQVQLAKGRIRLSILVVDDSSPDNTSQIVVNLAKKFSDIHLISGRKEGLGRAYMRGFRYAMQVLSADVVLEMDADFSHNPHEISRLIKKIEEGYDFVIGSRYVPGGSIPQTWGIFRKLNSYGANLLARHIAGLTNIHDCSGGYRAIRTRLLREIPLRQLNHGYGFQIALLHEAIRRGAAVKEIPIQFSDRVAGHSKMRFADMISFVLLCFSLRLTKHLGPRARSMRLRQLILAATVLLVLLRVVLVFQFTSTMLVALVSIILISQGLFSLFWMLYSWDDPEMAERQRSPKQYKKPKHSFTAIIPARHEEKVIADTIAAVSRINYPEHLKEILVVCRRDDKGTIRAAQKAITQHGQSNIKLISFSGYPINKPHSLNVGLRYVTSDVVVIFDAEDEPHRSVYRIVDTLMQREHYDVVQSGVQLMNYRKPWFASLNILEYFFWFKSGLHFFSGVGHVTPLGGNTVFFKRTWLKIVNGWDENCLTEDAEIGLRLTLEGAKIGVVYDEIHATQEETPLTAGSFVKQRTRWIQGFLQILLKGDWLELPGLKQRLFALYILLSSSWQALLLLYVPIALWIAMTHNLPVPIAILSQLPFYLLLMQLSVYVIGMHEFTKSYGLPFPILMPLRIVITFFPYQILVAISALRACFRLLLQKNLWEKTEHSNVHRLKDAPSGRVQLDYAKATE